MRKKRWLKRHTIIKGRLPHPPVLSATADLEKSHANKDAGVRRDSCEDAYLRPSSLTVQSLVDVQVTQELVKALRHSISAAKT
jgi:hypothetical protein